MVILNMEPSSPSAIVTMHGLLPDTTLASPSPVTDTSGIGNLTVRYPSCVCMQSDGFIDVPSYL